MTSGSAIVLVTGGCGFLGEDVMRAYLQRGFTVRSFDKATPERPLPDVDYVTGDIRDPAAVVRACQGVRVVVHAVAAVPLAKSQVEFRQTNVDGTRIAVESAQASGVGHFVYVSSSAVYGVPAANPVDEDAVRVPLEAYGTAKNDAEGVCRSLAGAGPTHISIVRPRTILGPGRLGIFGILFDWVSGGASVPVLGKGDNVYQFVHVTDLSEAIVEVSLREESDTFNIGGSDPDTMRAALDALCAHAGTGARTFRLPKLLFVWLTKVTSRLGLSPLAPYHWLMYGESLYFDDTKATGVLGWKPRFSSTAALLTSYDSYVATPTGDGATYSSPHRSTPRQGLLRLLRTVSKVLFSRPKRR